MFPFKKASAIEVEVTADGCWQCVSHGKNKDGYHSIKYKGKTLLVHRLAFMLRHDLEEVPSDMQIHHVCHNRSCANPIHMVMLTQKQHIQYYNNTREFNLGEWQAKNARPDMPRLLNYDSSLDQPTFPVHIGPLPKGDRIQVGIKKDNLIYFGENGRKVKFNTDNLDREFSGLTDWEIAWLDGHKVMKEADIEWVGCSTHEELERACKGIKTASLIKDTSNNYYTKKYWKKGTAVVKNNIAGTYLMLGNDKWPLFTIQLSTPDKSIERGITIKFKYSEFTPGKTPADARLIK